MKRQFVVFNLGLIACCVWEVHEGSPIGTVVQVGFLAAAFCNAVFVVKWFRTRDKPKPAPTGQFPWRQWGIGHAVAVGCIIMMALLGRSAADLLFISLLAFGGGNLLMVVFWLWDRHTLRSGAASDRGSADAGGEEESGPR